MCKVQQSLYYPNFQLSNFKTTLPTLFKLVILGFLLSDLSIIQSVTPPREGWIIEVLLYLVYGYNIHDPDKEMNPRLYCAIKVAYSKNKIKETTEMNKNDYNTKDRCQTQDHPTEIL